MMAEFTYSDVQTGAPVTIHFEERGSGPAVLLIAPGGMKSAIPLWGNAPFNPFEAWSGAFRVIAMDQRNAGRSTGPVHAQHGWQTYAQDQLALLDHLEVDRFAVAGMCIGGPYSLGLVQAVPERVTSVVIFQTIGLTDNRQAFYDMYDAWQQELAPNRPDVGAEDWQGLRENMYGGEDFLFNTDEAELARMSTPILALMGQDLYHPEQSSRRLVKAAPNAQLIEHWKTGDGIDAGRQRTLDFLKTHNS